MEEYSLQHQVVYQITNPEFSLSLSTSFSEKMKVAAIISAVSANVWRFRKIDGILYQFHDRVQAIANFWDQKEYCDGLGGGWQMPTPSNAKENDVVYQMLDQFYGGTFLGFAQARDYHLEYTG